MKAIVVTDQAAGTAGMTREGFRAVAEMIVRRLRMKRSTFSTEPSCRGRLRADGPAVTVILKQTLKDFDLPCQRGQPQQETPGRSPPAGRDLESSPDSELSVRTDSSGPPRFVGAVRELVREYLERVTTFTLSGADTYEGVCWSPRTVQGNEERCGRGAAVADSGRAGAGAGGVVREATTRPRVEGVVKRLRQAPPSCRLPLRVSAQAPAHRRTRTTRPEPYAGLDQ